MIFLCLGINDEGVDICIAAPAKDNEANEELLGFLRETLQVKKSSISLDKGSKSRNKLVVIEDDTIDIEGVYQILKSEIKN